MSCRRLNALLLSLLLLLLSSAQKLFSTVGWSSFRHVMMLLDLARREAVGLFSERMLVAQPTIRSIGGRIDCL